ncbi:permease prefix domain 1-containing protein [Isobaculum melis]|uniref:2TM domain-containing protein n=1 Tax=Isobaculum melis TaxID=142588 RepID=A0A1H9TZU5_9LACT|nr:permease prefix domain 1-containing protein [Isobaculum melis]SES02735.1 hypothetical protein SAMN04488559_1198 [Isobaculum melis]
MNKIDQFVEKIFAGIPETEETDTMKWDMQESLQERVRDLMEEGKTEEDAINKTIIDFGDIEDVRNELGLHRVVNKTKGETAFLNFLYALFGSALLISLFVFINLYYASTVLWWVYPTFAVLWWPLSMFFHWLKKRGEG